uniref:Uncharacterized protein n=1 Tax=Arundo donax TaxID=35708 RepID=A0A0A9B025_ARUDO
MCGCVAIFPLECLLYGFICNVSFFSRAYCRCFAYLFVY